MANRTIQVFFYLSQKLYKKKQMMNINTNTTKRIWNTISQDNRMDQQYINGKNSEDIIILIFRNDLGL